MTKVLASRKTFAAVAALFALATAYNARHTPSAQLGSNLSVSPVRISAQGPALAHAIAQPVPRS